MMDTNQPRGLFRLLAERDFVADNQESDMSRREALREYVSLKLLDCALRLAPSRTRAVFALGVRVALLEHVSGGQPACPR